MDIIAVIYRINEEHPARHNWKLNFTGGKWHLVSIYCAGCTWESQFLHNGQRFPSKPHFFRKMQRQIPKRRKRTIRTRRMMVIQSIVEDGLFVCTSSGGGDFTEIWGGTWRSVINKLSILCNDIENSIQTLRRDQERRGE